MCYCLLVLKSDKIFFFVILSFLFLLPAGNLLAQRYVVLSGTVSDTAGIPVTGANIIVEETKQGVFSAVDGYYELTLPAGKTYVLTVSHVGYAAQQRVLGLQAQAGDRIGDFHFILQDTVRVISEVAITSDRPPQGTLQRIETRGFNQLPNPSGGIETLLAALPGVSSNNELSAQYSVRGGNFDENLVYVNDIEIYRPVLTRSGQQEGLSFINPDIVESVDFSAGGFDVHYGDKMSSVLDVRYRKPVERATSVSLSFLGASASVEGTAGNQRFSYLAGTRYKTSQYLLATLDGKGDYNPAFFDIQSLMRYRITGAWELSLLVNVARNSYQFIPRSRSTSFGTLYNAYNLKVYYDGQEFDLYNSGLGALTLHFHPNEHLSLKLTGSAYHSHEQETFDIEGAYLLDELLDSSVHGDSVLNIGIGSELSHARNYLNTKINIFSHTGTFYMKDGSLRWSVSWQHELTGNRMSEWVMADSAGYSVPYGGENIRLKQSIHADNRLAMCHVTSSAQYTRQLSGNHLNWVFTAGVRLNYSSLNREWLISPRASVTVRPKTVTNLNGHIAAGMYGQPPSYRELRDAKGNMNTSLNAQRSIHYVAGAGYSFSIGQRPFKLSTELYYKQLSRLIPYRVENVRIYYAGGNMASGYITGWDIKLNGEFVEGAESWLSFSLMHTRGDIKNDRYGSYPLPTDQLANFNLFFQDYIPGASTWRMYLNLVFGSSLPYSYPDPGRYDQSFRMPSYRRADIGLSKEFFKAEKPHKFIRQIGLNAEIFNLFGTYNTVSYLWIQVISNQNGHQQQYAVPNYLTARRFNLKLSMLF